jgi:hypothetical protein
LIWVQSKFRFRARAGLFFSVWASYSTTTRYLRRFLFFNRQ